MYEYLLAFSWMVALCYLIFEARAKERGGGRAGDAPHGGAAGLRHHPAGALEASGSAEPPAAQQLADLPRFLRVNRLRRGGTGDGAGGVVFLQPHRSALRKAAARQRRWTARCIGAVRVAFPFLTLVLVTGAVWGYQAWGRWWGWDPKETWSLITWMIYTFYLHARRAQWSAAQANAVVLLGLGAILFTFLGVSRLAAFSGSLHSYGGDSARVGPRTAAPTDRNTRAGWGRVLRRRLRLGMTAHEIPRDCDARAGHSPGGEQARAGGAGVAALSEAVPHRAGKYGAAS